MTGGRARALAACAAAVAAVAVPVALAVTPTLSGESLTANKTLGIGAFDVTVDCHPDATSTVDFHADGAAAGPYPGTFVEQGRSTQERVGLGRPGFTGGRLLSFRSTFTIFATDGSLVFGEKTLDESTSEALTGLGSEGNCLGDQEQHLVDIRAHTFYTATIQRPDGTTLLDAGRSFVNAQSNTQGFVPDTFSFDESYVSTGPPPAVSTPGHVTGGGHAGALTFSVVAKSDSRGIDGGCTVADQATSAKVKCLTVDRFVRAGQHVTFSGVANVDGVETSYRVDVDDVCQSGTECDTFAIVTGTGFAGGGVLTAGNVKVHDN